MGRMCIAFSRVIVSVVVIIRDIVEDKYWVWITKQTLFNVKIFREYPQSYQMKFEKGLK